MRPEACSGFILFSLLAAFAGPLPADQRIIPPQVDKIWPVGIQRGTTSTFVLDGRNLSEIESVVFDAAGISANVTQVVDVPEKEMAVRVGVDTAAPVPRGKKQTAVIVISATKATTAGLHSFRIRTPLGTSNLMTFDVGAFPEVYAKEKVSVTHPSAFPLTFVGTIMVPGQVDTYSFDGRAGEEFVFKVTASPLGSSLESQLLVSDDAGKVLAQSGKYLNRPDAVLMYEVPHTGRYTLAVTDREKGGGANRFYRLDAGPLPYVSEVFPLGVQAGRPSSISVVGVNLGGMREVAVDPPKSTTGWTTMPLNVKGAGGWSVNTVKLAVGTDPEIQDQEPNNSASQAQSVPLPATVNGHISGQSDLGAPADEDYFRFHAKKNESITIDVAAGRLGSPFDSEIELLDAQGRAIPRATLRCLNETYVTLTDKDSRRPEIRLVSTSGLHESDYLMIGDELDRLTNIPDQPDADVDLRGAEGLRWASLGTSPDAHPINTPVYRVEILPPGAEFPPNGLPVFHLTWRNDDGGPGYGSDSRLDFVAPEDSDYILRLKDVRGLEGKNFAYRLSLHDAAPDYSLRADPLNPNIPQGGSTLVNVTANRVRGYDGPIAINVEGLAPGIHFRPATILARQDSTVVLLSADANASVDGPPAAFKIVGHAELEGIDQARVADAEAPLTVASVIPPPDAVVTASTDHVTLAPGEEAKVTLHVERRAGFRGRVPCTVINLPPGVRVVNLGLNGVLVTETQSSRTFTLHAERWAKPVSQPIYVVGKVESNSPTMHPSSPLLVEVVGDKDTASFSPNREAAADHEDGLPNR